MDHARELFLGFDVGTQGCKALAIDLQAGQVLARANCSYGLLPGLPDGHLEQDPAVWVEALRTTCGELLRSLPAANVRGLAISGQQHGAVVLDAAGKVVRPAKLWCDTATSQEAAELSAKLGRNIPTGFTASKLLWLARHEPAAWASVQHVLLPHDYLNFVLTGELAMECGDASGTGWFDARTRNWDVAAMHAIDARLPSMVPSLAPARRLHGRLHRQGANLLGLPAGVPVAQGGGDNMLSAIGSGAVESGVVVLSLGTSGTIFSRCEHAVVDPEGLIAPFCSSDGGWLPLLCVMNATGPLAEIAQCTALPHEALTDLAAAVAAGCGGTLLLPFLVGERVPDLPQATGALLGLRPGSLRPGVLYRAALEGVAQNLAHGFSRLQALGVAANEVRLVGGAAKNPLWQRILASMLALPVRPMLEAESGALGAALQTAWTVHAATGVTLRELTARFVQTGAAVAPEPMLQAVYAPLRERFQAASEQLFGRTAQRG